MDSDVLDILVVEKLVQFFEIMLAANKLSIRMNIIKIDLRILAELDFCICGRDVGRKRILSLVSYG